MASGMLRVWSRQHSFVPGGGVSRGNLYEQGHESISELRPDEDKVIEAMCGALVPDDSIRQTLNYLPWKNDKYDAYFSMPIY